MNRHGATVVQAPQVASLHDDNADRPWCAVLKR